MAEKKTEAPHTVPAGLMDEMLGLKGPNGELMHQGKPALVVDLPDDDDEED
jgi:ribosomal protein L6P/L9E